MEPELLGERYRVERELARGGMGRVFVAHDLKLDRDVALKVLPPGNHDEHAVLRFEQEARAAGGLQHPNVLAVHDIGTHQGAPYIISELLRGHTLRDELANGPLPASTAAEYARQLADGLSAAHAKGVIHRDLKPENLFITEQGVLKILDFGIAKLSKAPPVGPATETGAVVGTVGYMAPEQVRGQNVDPRADLFAFGTILYEMLSGKRAFHRPTRVETAYAILNDEPEPLPRSVPKALSRIARRCLLKDPEARFASAQQVRDALSVPGLGPPVRYRWLAPRVISALALIALAVTAGIGIALRLRRPQAPTYRQVTFQPGAVWTARFGPGDSIDYGVASSRDAPRLLAGRIGSPDAREIHPRANLLAVSRSGELAVLLEPRYVRYGFQLGTLALIVPPGAPRPVLDSVEFADFAPDGSTLAIVRTVAGRDRLEFPPGRVLYESLGWLSHVRVSPDGSLLAFLEHPSPTEDSGDVKVVAPGSPPRVLSAGWRSVQGLSWARGGREIWFTASATASGFNSALRAVTLDGSARILTSVSGDLVLHDIAADGTALVTHPDRKLGIETVLEGGAPRDLSWFDRPFINDVSRDGSLVLLTVEGSAAQADPSVYVRSTSGAPAVLLGPGTGAAFSPDGQWALSIDVLHGSPFATLLPTGVGTSSQLDLGGVVPSRVRWFPDGRAILVLGREQKKPLGLYVRRIEGGPAVRISDEDVSDRTPAISPDGARIAAVAENGETRLYPAGGGPGRTVPQVAVGEVPLGFAPDGALYVARLPEMPARVFKVELESGRRSHFRTLRPNGPGAQTIVRLMPAADGRTIVYNYASLTTHLYLLSGAE